MLSVISFDPSVLRYPTWRQFAPFPDAASGPKGYRGALAQALSVFGKSLAIEFA